MAASGVNKLSPRRLSTVASLSVHNDVWTILNISVLLAPPYPHITQQGGCRQSVTAGGNPTITAIFVSSLDTQQIFSFLFTFET